MKASLLLFLSMVIPCITACAQTPEKTINNETVKRLDLQRYMGKWYEIARFDHIFERGLVGNMAEYTLLSDGNIQVLNSGYKGDFSGKYKTAKGKSKTS